MSEENLVFTPAILQQLKEILGGCGWTNKDLETLLEGEMPSKVLQMLRCTNECDAGTVHSTTQPTPLSLKGSDNDVEKV